ncbi:MAG TPA: tetratricopeptide repeat protein, partial [Terriglobales bacterium]|nr:tetratricopeptide repeat protein [Terriglobales bacterium]
MKLQKTFLLLRGALFLFLFTFFGRSAASPQDLGDVPTRVELGKGVIADAVKKDSEAERAGLQVGDILLSWTRDGSKGEVESPFDLPLIEVEQAPRGAVTIEGLRGTEKRAWVLGPGSWGIHVRPNVPESLYVEGQKLVAAGKTQDAAQYWRSVVQAVQGSQPSWLAPWFLYHTGELLADARQWKEADSLFQEAIERSASESATKVLLLRAWAASFEQRADWENAKKYYQAAADASPKSNSKSLLFADILDGIGGGAGHHGDLVEAERSYSQALQIQQRLAPGSLILVKSLNGLGHIARRQGDLAKAEKYHSQALVISQKFDPGGRDVAASFQGLGTASMERGDLAKAEEYDSQALAIHERIGPGSIDVASSLLNLAIVATRRGDLSKAEEYNRQGLAIKEKLAPGSLSVAKTLENMGLVAIER